jgi:hypothetical protein
MGVESFRERHWGAAYPRAEVLMYHQPGDVVRRLIRMSPEAGLVSSVSILKRYRKRQEQGEDRNASHPLRQRNCRSNTPVYVFARQDKSHGYI